MTEWKNIITAGAKEKNNVNFSKRMLYSIKITKLFRIWGTCPQCSLYGSAPGSIAADVAYSLCWRKYSWLNEDTSACRCPSIVEYLTTRYRPDNSNYRLIFMKALAWKW